MSIETLDDVIEWCANQAMAYGSGPENDDHPDNCPCRICFTMGLRQRILAAIEVETIMQNGRAKLNYYNSRVFMGNPDFCTCGMCQPNVQGALHNTAPDKLIKKSELCAWHKAHGNEGLTYLYYGADYCLT